jgi:hypothetical protein
MLSLKTTFSKDKSNDGETYYSLFASSLYFPAANSKNLSLFSEIPYTIVNKYLNKFSACLKEVELLREITYSKYIFYAGK